MIMTFMRSSSYNSFQMCEQLFFLEYVLGMPKPSRAAMDKGTVVHKALEVMANVGICREMDWCAHVDKELGHIDIGEATPEWAVERAWDYYTAMSPHIEWKPSDLRDCLKWTRNALEFNGGQYDPRNMHVIDSERHFDFEIDEPWARYDYAMPDGTRLRGNLGLKGTIDLITGGGDGGNVIEIVDWKTGRRKDWSKEGFEKKTYAEMRLDPQLSLYHYAVSKLYPDADEVFVTIFYITDGGPYSFCFGREDLARTEAMIRRRFDEVKDVQVPHLNVGRKCTTFCHFGTTRSEQDPSKTICQFIHDKVVGNGIDRVVEEFGKKDHYLRYGDGGGRRDVD